MKLLRKNELCAAVLGISSFSKVSTPQIDENLRKEIEELIIPVYNPNELEQIQRELSTSKFVNVLAAHNYKFDYDKALVERLIDDRQFRLQYPKIFAIIVLHCSIKFMYECEQTNDTTCVFALLDALNILSSNDLDPSSLSLIQCTMSAFFQIVITLTTSNLEIDALRLIKLVSNFFTQNKNISSEYFDVFPRIANKLIPLAPNDLNNVSEEFLSAMDGLIRQKGPQFPANSITNMIPFLCASLNKLNKKSIEFLSRISKNVEISMLIPYIKMIPLAITANMEKSPQFIKPEITENIIIIDANHRFEQSTKIIPYKTFDDEIDLTNLLIFPPKLPFEELISSEDIKNKLDGVIESISLSKQVSDIFLESFGPAVENLEENDKKYDILAAILYVVSNIVEKIGGTPPKEVISSDTLFNASVTVYGNKTQFFKQVNTLRAVAVDMMAVEGVQVINTVIYHALTSPYLFAELANRLQNIQLAVDLSRANLQILTQALMYPMLFYQTYTGLDEAQQKAVNEARLSLFMLINNYLLSEEMFDAFFNDQLFVDSFVSLLYEAPVRNFVLSHFIRYFGIKSASKNTLILERVMSVAEYVINNLSDSSVIKLGSQLFSALTEVFYFSEDLIDFFETLIPDLCNGIVHIVKCEDSPQFLIGVFSVLNACAPRHSLTSPELAALRTAINRIHEKEPSQGLFIKMVQLIAGQPLASIHPSFTIRQPKALKLLVSCFQESVLLPTVLEFCASLILYSTENCEQAHAGGFDLFIIDMIYNWRYKEVSPKLIASAFSLFMLISNHVCSVAVVRKYISLWCPIDLKYLPYYHQQTIKSLNTMIDGAKKKPSAVLPLIHDCHFDYTGLNGEQFEEGFTISMWVFSNSVDPQYKPQIILLRDSEDTMIGLFMAANTLMVFFEQDGGQWSAKPDIVFPQKEWSFLSVSFFPDLVRQQYVIFASLNANEARQIYFPIIPFKKGPMKSGRIGGMSADSAVTKTFSVLGPVGVFPYLESDKVRAFYEAGPTGRIISGTKPIFYFVPTQVNDDVVLTNEANTPIITKTHSIKYSPKVSFTTILMTRVGLDIILPLFAQWDLTLQNGNDVPYLVESSLELLENALSLGESVQKMFCEANGFKIISHLVNSTNEKHINNTLYIRFFAILGVITYEPLQRQLFAHILMNAELWLRCDAEEHKRIVRHWDRVLCPSKDYIKFLRFDQILSILRIYYWSDSDPKNNATRCFNRCRGQHLNVVECRRSLLHIAKAVAMRNFTESDFKLLMSHILTVGSLQQNNDLLQLLSELVNEQTNKLKALGPVTNMITLLQYMFNLKNEFAVASTIELVIDAYHKNLINSLKIHDHIDIILHQLKPNFITKSLHIKLVEICAAKAPELFPICSWMAINIGNNATKFMLEKLKPNAKYTESPVWAQWLVVGMYKAGNELRKPIIKYLLSCCGDKVMQLMATVDIVGLALGEDTNMMKHEVIYEMGHQITSGNLIVTEGCYFKVLKHFMLFRDGENGSLALKSLYEKSPYVESKPRVRIHHGTPPRGCRDSPKKKQARKARHSLHPSALVHFEENTEHYSPLLAEQALSRLMPTPSPIQQNQSFKVRRVSMINVGPRAYQYETHSEQDVNVISLMPGDFDKKIAEVANKDFIYTFGLRFSNSGQWLDLDLAEQAMDVFCRIPDPAFAEITLLIAAFLIRYDSPKIDMVYSMIQNNPDLNGVLYLNAHHAASMEREISVKAKPEDCEIAAFNYMNAVAKKVDREMNAASLRFLKTVLKIQTINSTRAKDIYNMITDQIVLMASNTINDHTDKIAQQKENSNKLWQRLWHMMTIEHAPWTKSLPANARAEMHFKRDRSIVGNVCIPTKLKPNFKFNIHLDASLLRDKGNYATVQDILKQYEEQKAEEYAKEAPPQLFEVSGEEEKENKNEGVEVDNNNCIIEIPCELINEKKVINATFDLLKNGTIVLSLESGKVKVIDCKNIALLLFRTRFHHPTAIEIFMNDKKSYFINFINVKSIPVLKLFRRVELPSIALYQTVEFKPFFEALALTDKWVNRQMSNFEYLMKLNMFSGRTFNDPSQYPLLPWIISDYTSEKLDLNDRNVYRNLALPIGAIDAERLSILADKMNKFDVMGIDPYLYSSGPVCPLTVYLWLIRMEPFTSLHIDIQSGRFDHAARLFSSVAAAFKLCTTHQNDYRELIPEFYCEPEAFINSNKFNLGAVDDVPVDDVIFPPWAKNAYDFVYKNRKAMESEYVSQTINHWIDLIWGYKQDGKQAEQAYNSFLPQMYSTVWTKEVLENPQKRAEIEAVLCHVGQIPPKLFDRPHPTRGNQVPSLSTLSRPVSVSLNTRDIVCAAISTDSESNFKISVLDEVGLLATFVYDTSNLNKLSKKAIYKPRSRSGSDKVITMSPGKQWKNERRSVDNKITETIEVDSNDFNSSSKNVKNFGNVHRVGSHKDVAAFLKNTFYVVGSQANQVYKIRPSVGVAETILNQRSYVETLCADGKHVLTTNTDAIVSLYKISDFSKPVFSIPFFTSSVTCSALSELYYEAVCGTKDGTLMFISLSEGSITRTVNIGSRRAVNVLITSGWGFVVAHLTEIVNGVLKHFISIFTINGDLIKEVSIPAGVQSWSSYKDEAGFDFIVMVDEMGGVYRFEAFDLEIGNRLFIVDGRISAVKYIRDDSVIICVSHDGRAIFIPCE